MPRKAGKLNCSSRLLQEQNDSCCAACPALTRCWAAHSSHCQHFCLQQQELDPSSPDIFSNQRIRPWSHHLLLTPDRKGLYGAEWWTLFTNHREQVCVVIEISGLGFYLTKTSTPSDTSGMKLSVQLFNANENARCSVGQNQALHGLGQVCVLRARTL